MGARKRDTLPVPDSRRDLRPRCDTPLTLRVIGTGRELPLPTPGAMLRAGTDPDNDLVLEDRYASSFHFVLERRGPRRVILRDRGSRNGTYVNGVRVQETDVGPGARIQAGSTTLSVAGHRERGDPPARSLLTGEAPAFLEVLELAQRAARTGANVLVLGESGTGKELVARLVHEASPRGARPFVAVNCSAIPRELVESELFGHEKGAFTGATTARRGLFEQAHGGTLFLDEVGELPREQQPRLLRVLETRRARRVGGEAEHDADVRVIAATHRDLRGAAAAHDFRLDLYHRLATVELRLPALRDRKGDIALLVNRFLAETGLTARVDEPTMAALARYPWPGNVRELRNAVHRAALLGDGELRLRDLLPGSAGPPAPPPLPPAIDHHLDEVVRDMMARALAKLGSHRKAAAALGMSKSTFHDRARRYGLDSPRRGRGDRGAR